MNALIRLLYSLFIALTVIAFAALSVYSLYQPPKAPVEPDYYLSETQYTRQQDRYDKDKPKYDKNLKNYEKNVAWIALPAAIASTSAGAYLMLRRTAVVGEGLALGGAGLSIYAIIMASLGQGRYQRFIAALLLLTIALLTAYLRFNYTDDETKPKKPGKHQPPIAPIAS